MRNPYTFEEVEKILTTQCVKKTAEEMGRTYAAILSIRNKYFQWNKKGRNPLNNTILPLFEKYRDSGKEVSKLKRGPSASGDPLLVVKTEDNKEVFERKINTKELLTSVMKRYEKELQEVIYQMAQQMVLDLMQEQYKQTEKIVTTLTQRRLKKIL